MSTTFTIHKKEIFQSPTAIYQGPADMAPKYNNLKWVLVHLGNDIAYGLAFVAGDLLRRGHKILWVDGGDDIEKNIKRINKFSPSYICYGPLSTEFLQALKLAKAIKKVLPSVNNVFGGHHVKAIPEELKNEEAIDYLVWGPVYGSIDKIIESPLNTLIEGAPTLPAKNQVDDLMHECKKTIEKNYRVLVTTLTKKMAEDLTEYLHENGIKVRYMHSDIDTLERIEIMRDLRIGVFDVLVGINLLREGLDIPECALVGILDADKEGFLRSERSLIQTIGRAARNLDGKVILYADKKTNSINKAIEETDRRRAIQLKYNKKNNISATTIKKEISDVLESVYEKDYTKVGTGENIGGNLKKHLKALNKKMKESASNLEFEEAAKIRDEIRKLESTELEITLNPKVKQYNLNNKIYPKGRSTMGMPGTRAQKGKKKWKQIK